MLQRAKQKPSVMREALRLLQMRDALRIELGAEVYANKTAPFRPFVAKALAQLGCPKRAAAEVMAQLDSKLVNISIHRLVMCCALDLAAAEIPI